MWLKRIFLLIRNNKYFEYVIVWVIILSALSVWVKSFENNFLLKHIDILDYIITCIFLLEAVVKIFSEKRKRDYFKNWWNIFDFSILIVSLVPIFDSSSTYLARLLRILRVLRIIVIFPQLRVLIESLIKSFSSILSISVLLFIIIYIYAWFGNLFFSEINPDLWGNIFLSVFTLFRVLTLDWSATALEVMEVYPLASIYFISFIIVWVFAFLNLFIGTIIASMEEHREEEAKKNGKDLWIKVDLLNKELNEIKKLLHKK